mmetsp:Transcript_17416/g.21442  ORF Transcript_17416/g.21442 Transcript_17416/m.21442 type:complete len:125 (-) Transcript_17416:1008-1382(-)
MEKTNEIIDKVLALINRNWETSYLYHFDDQRYDKETDSHRVFATFSKVSTEKPIPQDIVKIEFMFNSDHSFYKIENEKYVRPIESFSDVFLDRVISIKQGLRAEYGYLVCAEKENSNLIIHSTT